ncbi:MAG: urate hydroxylase PuuD [Candidatus Marinimicrobia bacterium]|nr:urate hydroxylase PuuD [Candidatus Neomarinimicrobiota bacterium]
MDELFNMLFRWGHILVGITWIGLLYYFNFVQTEYFKEAEEEARKDAVAKLAPRALWWFRWAALFTFLTGVVLLYFITMRLNLDIIFGAIMGTLMMLNVWGIIWPNQKIVIGLKDGDATVAGPKAALASRTNTLFSVPMLYFMVSSAHYPHGGYLLAGNMSMESFYVGLLIILAIEANAIWGKMLTIITSVRDVIVSGFVLAIALSSVAYYL